MRKFYFLAVAAAALALLGADQAKAGGRRTRYYSYGGTAVTQRTTTPSAQATNQTAQSPNTTTTRRYSYAPSTQAAGTRYAPANAPFTMGSTPYGPNYFRADRKIKGY